MTREKLIRTAEAILQDFHMRPEFEPLGIVIIVTNDTNMAEILYNDDDAACKVAETIAALLGNFVQNPPREVVLRERAGG